MKKFFLLASFIAALYITACNDASTTTAGEGKNDSTAATQEDREERNKKTALASVNAFMSGNADEALKDAAPDAMDYGDGSIAAIKGVDSIKAGMKGYMASFEVKGDNIEAVADGDYVYVSGDWTYTWKNDYMGMKASGKSVKYKDVDIFKFNNDGKITEHRSIVPWAYGMQAMGVPQPK
ncbi:MAG TPA: ester cyclase [Chitinophagaceae bacterium]|nr:ester cyclase [Chitinophagaceae bacterium]